MIDTNGNGLRLPFANVIDVAQRQLCAGCGVCAYLHPESIAMVDDLDQGRRPVAVGHGPEPATDAGLRACPGASLRRPEVNGDGALVRSLHAAWGPVYEVWEGYAADPEIRFAGSSGGATTALALYALERAGFHGVLHTAARADVPHLNETVMSRTRAELLARTGSRYAPASPGDGLRMIEDAPGPCVFIGKPCDVAAVQSARRERPGLHGRIGLTIAFFCAGTPSARGTLDLLRRAGVPPAAHIETIRYRGHGWPGRWTVCFRDGAGRAQQRSLSYEESWGFLQRYRQWRCYICPDHTGEFADIAVGDPWHRPVGNGEPGRSLIVARTAAGLAFLRAATAAGHLVLDRQDPALLPASQPNLLQTRGALWGRLLVLRAMGIATPRFRNFPSARFWWGRLPLRQKLQSLVGTMRRIRRKGLHRLRPVLVNHL